jgi:hypothetical protein
VTSSCRWYVGIPGAGKTTLARRHACELAAAERKPIVFVDSAGVANFEDVQHARSLKDLVRLVWIDGQHAAWIPSSSEDVEQLVGQVAARGSVVLLVDEAAFWLSSSRGRGGGLLRLMRAHRHARVHLLLTTQHLSGDVPQEALSCAPDLYVFRCTSPAVLDRLEREYGVNRREVSCLTRGEFLHLSTSFSVDTPRQGNARKGRADKHSNTRSKWKSRNSRSRPAAPSSGTSSPKSSS